MTPPNTTPRCAQFVRGAKQCGRVAEFRFTYRPDDPKLCASLLNCWKHALANELEATARQIPFHREPLNAAPPNTTPRDPERT